MNSKTENLDVKENTKLVSDDARTSYWSLFTIFLRLGLKSFGGPIAHLAFFREEFVLRRKWLTEHGYADLISLCQFLPGPASSQVGIAIGLGRRGISGGAVSWLGFTLPSAVLLVLFAYGRAELSEVLGPGFFHGLKVVAVAVVAQALIVMSKSLCPDLIRASFAFVASLLAFALPSALGQIAIIILGGVLGSFLLNKLEKPPHSPLPKQLSKTSGVVALVVFVSLFVILGALANASDNLAIQQMEAFYRTGSLVFGGGHVVLPLLQVELVPPGWVSNDIFLAGYGAAQAVPGPLFTFAAYLGAVSTVQPSGWIGATISLLAIFLPGFLLIIGVFPFWEQIRSYKSMQSALQGINATVVGLLLAAFYHPVWTSAINNWKDFALGMAAFLLLMLWKIPSWLVVAISAILGATFLRN